MPRTDSDHEDPPMTPSTHTWHDGFGGDDAAGEQLRHWAHHDLAVLRDGRIVTPAPEGGLVILDAGGVVVDRVETDTNEIHGMTAIIDDDRELLWLADCGFVMRAGDDGQYAPAGRGSRGPRAVLVDLEGTEIRSLGVPEHEAYADALFLPTSVVEDEVRLGGSGDVWVADGYGASLVHCVAPDGSRRLTLDGTENAGRFDCPHNVFIDRRRPAPRLLVSDRGNARVQTYDLAGQPLGSFGDEVLTSPSAFATFDDQLVIAELHARLVILDRDDRLVAELFPGGEVIERPGWPNALVGDAPVRPPLVPEQFNSPHGLAVDADGRVLVSEWLIGGRLVELRPATTPEA